MFNIRVFAFPCLSSLSALLVVKVRNAESYNIKQKIYVLMLIATTMYISKDSRTPELKAAMNEVMVMLGTNATQCTKCRLQCRNVDFNITLLLHNGPQHPPAIETPSQHTIIAPPPPKLNSTSPITALRSK